MAIGLFKIFIMEIFRTSKVTLQSKLMTKVAIQDYADVRNRSVCDPDVVFPNEILKKKGY